MKLEHALETLIYDLRKARLGLRVPSQPVIQDKDMHVAQHRLSGMQQVSSAHPNYYNKPFREWEQIPARKMEQGFVPSNPSFTFGLQKGRLEEPNLLGGLKPSGASGSDAESLGLERIHLSSSACSSAARTPKSATCFVFYLPPLVTSDILRQLFMRFGTVLNAYVPLDKVTKRPCGFGFVDFSTPAEAQAAVEGMNKFPLDGKFLSVSLKR